jgi:hypothetical protein
MIIGLAATAGSILLASPDGSARLEIASDGSTQRLARNGEQILAASQLGLSLANSPAFGKLGLVGAERATIPADAPDGGADGMSPLQVRTKPDRKDELVLEYLREAEPTHQCKMIWIARA